MDFRSIWSLDPKTTFLNHGSFGACPTSVLEHQTELRKRQEREPMRFFTRELEPLLDEARADLARLVGCSPQSLAFVTNATTGINTVLRSLRFAAGEEILTTSHVYAACKNALEFIADRQGLSLRVVDLPFPVKSDDDVTQLILAEVTDRTRLALIDHVTSATGLVLPIHSIVRALAARGVETLVDGAHAPGMVDVDIAKLKPTYYAANCHKWLCAPKGAGFLYVKPEKLDEIRPLTISHGAKVQHANQSRFEAEFAWQGTDDPSACLCVPMAIELLGSLLPGGWPELRASNRRLVLQARELISSELSFPLTCPDDMIGSLATLSIPDAFLPPVINALGADGLRFLLLDAHAIEVLVSEFPPDTGKLCLRISAMLYNEFEDYERLVRALREIGRG